MKKLLLFAAIMAFVSCSGDDNDKQIEPQPVYTPKNKLKIVENIIHLDSVISEDGVVTRFPYDAFIDNEYIYGQNGFVNKEIERSRGFSGSESKEFVIEYSYINDKIHSKKTFSNGVFTSAQYYTYTDELITRLESGRSYSNYIYNSSNQLIREEYFSPKNEPRPTHLFDFIYKDENIIKIEITVNNKKTTEEFIYDDKNNPYYDMYPEALSKVLRIGKHNAIKNNDRGYIFNYNSIEYPVTRSTSDNSSDATYEYFK